jgi:hypothetical protein
MGSPTDRSNFVHENREADLWQDFRDKFMQLANEEERIERTAPNDRLLRASCTYQQHPEVWETGKPHQGLMCLLKTPACGLWVIYDAVNENFQERFRALAARAGVALGSPKGTDPEDFWLHRLFFDLLENHSNELFAASEEGGMVLRVCVASGTYCARLERKALEQSEPSKRVVPDPESTSAGAAEAPLPNTGFGISTDALCEIEETVYAHFDGKALMIEFLPVWQDLKQSNPFAPVELMGRAKQFMLAEDVAWEVASRIRPLLVEAACEYAEMLTKTILQHHRQDGVGAEVHWSAIADQALAFCVTLTLWQNSARWLYGPLKMTGLHWEDIGPRTRPAYLAALSGWMLVGPHSQPSLSKEPTAEGVADLLRRKIRHIVRLAPEKKAPTNRSFTHTEDYRSVVVRGANYTLTTGQAQMIEILHEAFKNGTPNISAAYIMDRRGTPNSRWQDTWKGNRDALKALIKTGPSKGTLHLNV